MEVIVNEVTPQVTVNSVTVSPVLDSTIVNLNTPVPGKSTYQSALDNGFVGTEAEWLESLKGGGAELTSYEQVSTLPNYPTAFPPEEHNHDGLYARPGDLISFITAEDLPDVSNFITLDDLPDTSAFLTSADLPDVSGFLTAADLPDLDGYATDVDLEGKADQDHRHDYSDIDNPPEVGIPSTITLNSSTDQITSITVQDDGTPTNSWPNRWEAWFVPAGGPAKLVQWDNEYYEHRIMPAKKNTVAQRIFVATDATSYAERSVDSPVWQVVNYRNGGGARSPLVQVSKESMDVTIPMNVDHPIIHQGHTMAYVAVIDHDADASSLPEGTVFFRRPAP